MSYSITRYHDFSAGHRVVGHESKCAYLHGHNYRVHFYARSKFTEDHNALDKVGRVVDFSVLKELGFWLEDNWDHRTLIWQQDPMRNYLIESFSDSVLQVPFNPTAENMAEYLTVAVGPRILDQFGVVLYAVTVEETRKCSARYSI